MSFRCLGDRILVKADKPPEKTRGGLFIPATAAKSEQRKNGLTGVVRYIGPGMLTDQGERWPMPDVRVGDRIVYLDQPWPTVKLADEELVSLRDIAILAVVENDR
jgi:chaperonin GroES